MNDRLQAKITEQHQEFSDKLGELEKNKTNEEIPDNGREILIMKTTREETVGEVIMAEVNKTWGK